MKLKVTDLAHLASDRYPYTHRVEVYADALASDKVSAWLKENEIPYTQTGWGGVLSPQRCCYMVDAEVGMNTVLVPVKYRFVYNQQGSPVWWDWCIETLGPPNNSQLGIPASEHYWHLQPGPGYKMWFADPAHATLFRLRWL